MSPNLRRFKPHLLVAALAISPAAQAVPLVVNNHSFEDVSAQTNPGNEFHFGVNTDWALYGRVAVSPKNGAGSTNLFLGTLEPGFPGTNPVFFPPGAPDGDQVALLFGFGQGRGNPAIDSTMAGE
jgi:hypothetical protein